MSDLDINPEHYQEAAILAYEVGEQMIARLDWMVLQPKRLIDMGCGTGHHTPLLKKRYPNAELISLDYTLPRIQFAKNRYLESDTAWICTDVQALPFLDHSIDLIMANLILPWCHSIESALLEWKRILRPNGLLMLTCLGPDTLQEFNIQSIRPQLIDMHHWGDLLMQTGFADPVMDVDYITLRYKDSQKMQHELFATEMLTERRPMEDPLSVTYEIIFGTAWAKEEIEHKEDIIKIPIHTILK